jgi:predicted Holliday junction resolvase-like endonuclease
MSKRTGVLIIVVCLLVMVLCVTLSRIDQLRDDLKAADAQIEVLEELTQASCPREMGDKVLVYTQLINDREQSAVLKCYYRRGPL